MTTSKRSAHTFELDRLFADADGTEMAHRIVLEIEKDWVTATVVCESGRDAGCRTGCIDPLCEGDGCDHPRKRLDYCNVQTWIENDGWQDTHIGDCTLLRSAWITPVWQGDHFGWHYQIDRQGDEQAKAS